MHKLNYGFGTISLIMGLGLIAASFSRSVTLSLGIIVGALLVLNGLGRLWLVWQRRSAQVQGGAASGRPRSYSRQDKV